MKNKKVTLWAIIVLLILFLPITIFSTTMHFIQKETKDQNINHAFKFNGQLYFYKEDELLGTYTCQNFDSYCDYAFSTVKKEYALNEPEVEKNTKLPIINDRYVFLLDDEIEKINDTDILLYDLVLGKVLGKYKEVKDYGIGIENDYYILKNQSNLWGVVSFEDGIALKVPFQYDYIGLIDKLDDTSNKIASDIFATRKNEQWQLMDSNNATFASEINQEIFSYNSEYIVVKQKNGMQLIDYRRNIILPSMEYINFYSKFLEIIDANNEFYLYDLNKQTKISNSYSVSSIEDIELKTEENKISILRNGNVEETIAIQ